MTNPSPLLLDTLNTLNSKLDKFTQPQAAATSSANTAVAETPLDKLKRTTQEKLLVIDREAKENLSDDVYQTFREALQSSQTDITQYNPYSNAEDTLQRSAARAARMYR